MSAYCAKQLGSDTSNRLVCASPEFLLLPSACLWQGPWLRLHSPIIIMNFGNVRTVINSPFYRCKIRIWGQNQNLALVISGPILILGGSCLPEPGR